MESDFTGTTVKLTLLKAIAGFHPDLAHNLAMRITGRAKETRGQPFLMQGALLEPPAFPSEAEKLVPLAPLCQSCSGHQSCALQQCTTAPSHKSIMVSLSIQYLHM